MNFACRYCNAENPADARFCKLCGQPLAAEATSRLSTAEVEETVQDGYRLLADGKPHEALYVAKAALAQAPDNLGGLALKGMALEALDDLPGAVACFERIVELNPSSTLDRIKLEQLHRRLYETPYEETTKEANWTAILAGFGATLVVIALGALLALNQKEPTETIASAEPETTVATFQPIEQPPQQTPQQPQTNQPAQNEPPTSTGSAIRPPSLGGGNTPFSGPIILTPDQVSGLPDVHAQGGGSNRNVGGEESRGEPPVSSPPPSNPGDDNVISPPARDPVIQIKPHEGRGGGAGSGGSERESENIYRIANEKMKAGDYRGAIADFQKSLSGSTRPALTHQLIARCYRALGEFDNAKRHFEQALRLYEASNAPGAQAGAEACRRELAALGG